MDVQVTIGRDLLGSGLPMSSDMWSDFRTDAGVVVEAHCEGRGVEVLFHLSTDEWRDPQRGAVRTETCKVTVTNVNHVARDALIEDLAMLAYDYDQWAIPVTVAVPLTARAYVPA